VIVPFILNRTVKTLKSAYFAEIARFLDDGV